MIIDIRDGEFHPWDIEDNVKRFPEEFHSLPESIQTELRRVIKEYKYNKLGENEEHQNKRSLEEMQKSLVNLEKLVLREIHIRSEKFPELSNKEFREQ